MILGIDIGGTSSKLGLVDQGKVITHMRIDTAGSHDVNTFVESLANASRALIGDKTITSVGIGAPNGNQLTGHIENAPNLPWKGAVPFAQLVGEKLGVPCTLGNDANAAAMGVAKYDVGQGCKDLLVVTLGTGLGSGFISDGRIILGPRGNAGELGHSNVVLDGRPCSCGCKGCLEAYVSIRGIRETYRQLADNTALLNTAGVLPIANAAKEGDPIAIQTFTNTARWLAAGLASAVAIFAPSKVVLFGGIARSGNLLLEPLRLHFEAFLMPIHQKKVELLLSKLPEDDAAILGAAALTL